MTDEALRAIAVAGHHIALHIGFAFPLIEYNEWPRVWVDHYTSRSLVLRDPVMRWVYSHNGVCRWSEIDDPDPDGVLAQAEVFGLRYGAAVACRSGKSARSFGIFAHDSREFDDAELARLQAHVVALHQAKAPPRNLTRAELEALDMVRRGLRQKQIAHDLGITEGAVKQRLRNAKLKLKASTAAQAAASAREYGLI